MFFFCISDNVEVKEEDGTLTGRKSVVSKIKFTASSNDNQATYACEAVHGGLRGLTMRVSFLLSVQCECTLWPEAIVRKCFKIWVVKKGVVMFFPCLFCPSDNFETCLALPTRWHGSVRALSYWYLFCDPRRWDNSRKVRVSASGLQHVVTWTKETWTLKQCTSKKYYCCLCILWTYSTFVQNKNDVLCVFSLKLYFTCMYYIVAGVNRRVDFA